ncbi:RNA polymerase sigma factor [Chitinophaga caeni]|nr:sigma-70 family RNA polymerase sigma factor [Chitinophaga caeni]
MTGEEFSTLADRELLILIAQGDEQAFTSLYWKYSTPLLGNLVKLVKDQLLAEELLQELFTKVWQKRESLQVDKDFKAYLFRMAYHLVVDFYRKLQRDKSLLSHFQEVISGNYSHIEEIFNLKDSQQLLDKALDRLSPQQRKVFQLCRLEGRTYKETAELLNISQHTVKEYFVKANASVRHYLSEHTDIALVLLMIHIIHHSV